MNLPSSGECRLLTESKVRNLGTSIEPAEVRLITRADDPYTWQILPENQYLFEKHLSKYSIGRTESYVEKLVYRLSPFRRLKRAILPRAHCLRKDKELW